MEKLKSLEYNRNVKKIFCDFKFFDTLLHVTYIFFEDTFLKHLIICILPLLKKNIENSV